MDTNIEAAKAHLLVVDDDPEMRTLIGRMLHREGHVVVEAANGREALKHIDAQSFDLVVSDLFMPDTDGIELIHTLHRQTPNLPLVAMSGGGFDDGKDVLAVARLLGAVAIVQKPLTRQKLVGAIRRALGPPRHDG